MRRLKRRDNGALNLMEDREDDDILKRYQYIILSHIWFQEDETTFPQFINGKGLKSAGYKKIHFYAKESGRWAMASNTSGLTPAALYRQ
jgi:hypothetical protein